MKNRICHRMLALAMLVALLTGIAMLALRLQDGLHELSEQTSRQAAIAQAGYLHAADPTAALHAIGESDRSRVTLIAKDGSGNSMIPMQISHKWKIMPHVQKFKWHKRLEEEKEVRFSSTLNTLTCYVALPLPNGDILRVANTTTC